MASRLHRELQAGGRGVSRASPGLRPAPEDFGMDATFAEYLGMSERALWHLLPIVRAKVGFGEHDQAEQAEYMQLVESFRNTMLVQELQDSEINL